MRRHGAASGVRRAMRGMDRTGSSSESVLCSRMMIRFARLSRRKFVRILLLLVAVAFLAELGLRVAGHFYLASFYKRQYEALPDGLEAINIVCLGESSTAGLWVDWQ